MTVETQGRSGNQFRRKSKKPTVSRLDKKVKKIARELQPESKVSNTASARVIIPTGGQIDPLSLIVQGDTEEDRNGNEVKVHSIQMRYDIKAQLQPNPPTNLVNTVRVIVFYWRDSSVPTVLQVLNLADPLAPLAQNETNQIKIVYDNLYCLNPAFLTLGEAQPIPLTDSFTNDKFYKKLNLRYKYTADVATQPNKNQLYILYISDDVNHAIRYYSRVRFTDA